MLADRILPSGRRWSCTLAQKTGIFIHPREEPRTSMMKPLSEQRETRVRFSLRPAVSGRTGVPSFTRLGDVTRDRLGRTIEHAESKQATLLFEANRRSNRALQGTIWPDNHIFCFLHSNCSCYPVQLGRKYYLSTCRHRSFAALQFGGHPQRSLVRR